METIVNQWAEQFEDGEWQLFTTLLIKPNQPSSLPFYAVRSRNVNYFELTAEAEAFIHEPEPHWPQQRPIAEISEEHYISYDTGETMDVADELKQLRPQIPSVAQSGSIAR